MKYQWFFDLVKVYKSLPVRECGLKYIQTFNRARTGLVTPCAGVWIEIELLTTPQGKEIVTPCAGVWIEITLRPIRDRPPSGHSLCGSVD